VQSGTVPLSTQHLLQSDDSILLAKLIKRNPNRYVDDLKTVIASRHERLKPRVPTESIAPGDSVSNVGTRSLPTEAPQVTRQRRRLFANPKTAIGNLFHSKAVILHGGDFSFPESDRQTARDDNDTAALTHPRSSRRIQAESDLVQALENSQVESRRNHKRDTTLAEEDLEDERLHTRLAELAILHHNLSEIDRYNAENEKARIESEKRRQRVEREHCERKARTQKEQLEWQLMQDRRQEAQQESLSHQIEADRMLAYQIQEDTLCRQLDLNHVAPTAGATTTTSISDRCIDG